MSDVEGRTHLLVPERAAMACGRKIGEHWSSALNIEYVTCPDCLANQNVSLLDARRQSAREAAYDEIVDGAFYHPRSIEAGIEVATRVEITEDIIEAALNAVSAGRGARPRYANAITAAFRAAGFEVVE